MLPFIPAYSTHVQSLDIFLHYIISRIAAGLVLSTSDTVVPHNLLFISYRYLTYFVRAKVSTFLLVSIMQCDMISLSQVCWLSAYHRLHAEIVIISVHVATAWTGRV